MADTKLEVGQNAPELTLDDQGGTPFSLSAQKGRKVLVYFYPKADTPGCTTQACGLRDIKEDIGDAVVVGISPDTSESQQKFDDKFGLGFPLLADTQHEAAEAYGVWGERSMYGRKYLGINRSAFLINEEGVLQEVWYMISPKDTPTNLLKALA